MTPSHPTAPKNLLKSFCLLLYFVGSIEGALYAQGAPSLFSGSTLFWGPGRPLALFFLALSVLSYLSGSVPYGLLLTKFKSKKDLRHIGSGNIGATNVLRTGSKSLAALTLFLDALKGALCVLLVQAQAFISCFFSFFQPSVPNAIMPNPEILAYLVASAALIGHLYPIWLSYKGGKGIATLAGLLACFSPLVLGGALLAWLIVFYATRLSSLAAILALITAPVFSYIEDLLISAQEAHSRFLTLWLIGVSLLLLGRHHSNISRLLTGREKKIDL